jgi:hypothetical protein
MSKVLFAVHFMKKIRRWDSVDYSLLHLLDAATVANSSGVKNSKATWSKIYLQVNFTSDAKLFYAERNPWVFSIG